MTKPLKYIYSNMKKLSILVALLSWITAPVFSQQKNQTENIILITLDGFRWQEVFNGADSSFMRQQKQLKDPQLKEEILAR